MQGGLSSLAGSDATSGYAAIVLDRLARQACQVLESAGSTIFARDRRAPGTAIAVAACGRDAEMVGSRFPAFEGFAGTVLNAGARATVPACWRGQVNGALAADSFAGRRFDRRDLAVLGELATTAGAALDHAERRRYVLREVRSRVRALVRKLDAHDGYTAGHSSEVVGWACAVGERLRLSLPDLLELELGALLHDLGKVRVPDRVLSKPRPLDPAERELVNRHPVWGAELLEQVPGLEPVATIVRFHHERWDGTGYPDRKPSEEIPLVARILFVADAYDAMTNDRIYRPKLSHERALAELERCAGTQFDPAVVAAVVEELAERAAG